MENSSYAAEDTKSCPCGHWRPNQDKKFRQLVEQYDAQNWNSIDEKLQGRSGMYHVILIKALLLIDWLASLFNFQIHSKIHIVDYYDLLNSSCTQLIKSFIN